MAIDKRKINSKGWLYLALLDLVKSKNIAEVTVSELTKHASIGRATFYRLYNSIDEILIEEIKSEIDQFLNYIQNFENYDGVNYLKEFLEYWNTHSEVIEVLLKANKTQLFYQVMNEMTYKENISYDFCFIVGGSTHALVTWIANGRKGTMDEITQQISSKFHF